MLQRIEISPNELLGSRSEKVSSDPSSPIATSSCTTIVWVKHQLIKLWQHQDHNSIKVYVLLCRKGITRYLGMTVTTTRILWSTFITFCGIENIWKPIPACKHQMDKEQHLQVNKYMISNTQIYFMLTEIKKNGIGDI